MWSGSSSFRIEEKLFARIFEKLNSAFLRSKLRCPCYLHYFQEVWRNSMVRILKLCVACTTAVDFARSHPTSFLSSIRDSTLMNGFMLSFSNSMWTWYMILNVFAVTITSNLCCLNFFLEILAIKKCFLLLSNKTYLATIVKDSELLRSREMWMKFRIYLRKNLITVIHKSGWVKLPPPGYSLKNRRNTTFEPTSRLCIVTFTVEKTAAYFSHHSNLRYRI